MVVGGLKLQAKRVSRGLCGLRDRVFLGRNHNGRIRVVFVYVFGAIAYIYIYNE